MTLEDAQNIARAWSGHVWLSACDLGDPDSTEVGASTLCNACDGEAGPTHGELARERSAAFLHELKRRGIEDGVPIPDDLGAMDEAPEGFDEWPDPLTIEHDEDCPIRFLLEQAALVEELRAEVQGAHHDARVLEEQLGVVREELVATVQLERVTGFVQPLVREWRATARELTAASPPERAKADALRECADQLAVVTERFVETREAELAGYLNEEDPQP